MRVLVGRWPQPSVIRRYSAVTALEMRGDYPLRYFIEPVVLTANYAESVGYEEISMAGLSGGGWSTTFAPAVRLGPLL